MTTKTIHTCDLCHQEMKFYNPHGTRMVSGPMGGDNQRWPVGERIFDVCKACCLILNTAKQLGIIDYDTKPLLKQEGFTYDEKNEVWVKGEIGNGEKYYLKEEG